MCVDVKKKTTTKTIQKHRAILGTPGVVAVLQPHSTVLHVATTATDRVDALLSQLCHGRRSTELELALFDHFACGRGLVHCRAAAGGTLLRLQ